MIVPTVTSTDSEVEPIPQPDRFTIAVASLSSAFLVISVFTFIIGFACGSHFRCKSTLSDNEAQVEAPIPVYEDIRLSEQKNKSECDLTENVAYIPSTEILN